MLMIMTAAMQVSFATWQALLNNFAIGQAGFDGADIGVLQSVREIPGFLAFTAVFLLLFVREQAFALISLVILGIGTAMTGYFPTLIGFSITTLIMSTGFHYYETMNQSLALQWLAKEKAPVVLGKIIAVGSTAALVVYGGLFVSFDYFDLAFTWVYMAAGGATIAVAFGLWLTFPQFKQPVVQHKKLLLRQRYWLYYALTFMSGARRQIFIVFAGFLMVEKFGFSVSAIAGLFLANCVFNMVAAPLIGGLVGRWGERRMLTIEYIGLIGVFVAYAFVENPWIASGLYLIDHAFFAMAIAMKTYFQKIADPADIAPTAGVAFTINHIAAIFIPIAFGLIWLWSVSAVFLLGAAMALVSLVLSRLIPRDPEPGYEVVWKPQPARQAAAAE